MGSECDYLSSPKIIWVQFVALLSLVYMCTVIANITTDISPKYLQEVKGVLHPWALFLKTFVHFLKK